MDRSIPVRPDAVFVSVEETCALLHLSRTAVFDLIRTRALASVRHGKRRLVSRRSVEAWAANQLADSGFTFDA